MAYPLRIAQTVRDAAGDIAVGARITGSDWAEDGLTITNATMLATRLKAIGIDYACVTSSGIPVSNPTVANAEDEHPVARRSRAARAASRRVPSA